MIREYDTDVDNQEEYVEYHEQNVEQTLDHKDVDVLQAYYWLIKEVGRLVFLEKFGMFFPNRTQTLPLRNIETTVPFLNIDGIFNRGIDFEDKKSCKEWNTEDKEKTNDANCKSGKIQNLNYFYQAYYVYQIYNVNLVY